MYRHLHVLGKFREVQSNKVAFLGFDYQSNRKVWFIIPKSIVRDIVSFRHEEAIIEQKGFRFTIKRANSGFTVKQTN